MSRPARVVLPAGVCRPRARIADLVGEATSGITRRKARSLLTALGTVLGVGAFVVTLGLTATANAQISDRFDVLKATEVRLEDNQPDPYQPVPFPPDTDQRLEALNGVLAAGRYWTVIVGSIPHVVTSVRSSAAPVGVVISCGARPPSTGTPDSSAKTAGPGTGTGPWAPPV